MRNTYLQVRQALSEFRPQQLGRSFRGERRAYRGSVVPLRSRRCNRTVLPLPTLQRAGSAQAQLAGTVGNRMPCGCGERLAIPCSDVAIRINVFDRRSQSLTRGAAAVSPGHELA